MAPRIKTSAHHDFSTSPRNCTSKEIAECKQRPYGFSRGLPSTTGTKEEEDEDDDEELTSGSTKLFSRWTAACGQHSSPRNNGQAFQVILWVFVPRFGVNICIARRSTREPAVIGSYPGWRQMGELVVSVAMCRLAYIDHVCYKSGSCRGLPGRIYLCTSIDAAYIGGGSTKLTLCTNSTVIPSCSQ